MTDNEIKFMKLFEEKILPNRKNVSISLLKEAADLIGVGINTSCRTCAAKSSSDLLNRYGGMKPKYDEYLQNRSVNDTKMVIETVYDVDLKTGEMSELSSETIKKTMPKIKKIVDDAN